MFYAMLMYTCLATGGDCRYHQVELPRMYLMGCLMQGQIEGVRYNELHPKRVFKKIRCMPFDRVPGFLGRNQA